MTKRFSGILCPRWRKEFHWNLHRSVSKELTSQAWGFLHPLFYHSHPDALWHSGLRDISPDTEHLLPLPESPTNFMRLSNFSFQKLSIPRVGDINDFSLVATQTQYCENQGMIRADLEMSSCDNTPFLIDWWYIWSMFYPASGLWDCVIRYRKKHYLGISCLYHPTARKLC